MTGISENIVFGEESCGWFRKVHPEHAGMVNDYLPEMVNRYFDDVRCYENEDEFQEEDDD